MPFRILHRVDRNPKFLCAAVGVPIEQVGRALHTTPFADLPGGANMNVYTDTERARNCHMPYDPKLHDRTTLHHSWPASTTERYPHDDQHIALPGVSYTSKLEENRDFLQRMARVDDEVLTDAV